MKEVEKSSVESPLESYDPKTMSFADWRKFMGVFLRHNSAASLAWDLMTCLRGPDSPSERGGMSSAEAAAAYQGRRERKYRTVEVIRSAAFGGGVGGCARSHPGTAIQLPSRGEWDHFDRHADRAARVVDLKVEVAEK